MRWFRRPAGRHALGAAVTAIPSGPLTIADGSAAPAVPAPAPTKPDLVTSIAALISSGEAWNAPSEPQDRQPLQSWSRPAPAPAPAPSPATSAPATPAPGTPDRSALEEALAGLLPQTDTDLPTGPPSEASPPVAAQPLSRVQLGFRDGTSTTLDPSSSQSLALEQLAQSLTRRD